MVKWFLVIAFSLQLAGCKTGSETSAGEWLVVSSIPDNPVFRQGTVIQLGLDSMRVAGEGKKVSFFYIMNNNRLLLYDGKTKRLFQLTYSVDEMILSELYQQNPMVVKLKKYQRHSQSPR